MTDKKIVFSEQYRDLTAQISINFNGKSGKLSSLYHLKISNRGFLHT